MARGRYLLLHMRNGAPNHVTARAPLIFSRSFFGAARGRAAARYVLDLRLMLHFGVTYNSPRRVVYSFSRQHVRALSSIGTFSSTRHHDEQHVTGRGWYIRTRDAKTCGREGARREPRGLCTALVRDCGGLWGSRACGTVHERVTD
jgi:hypothetical protein